MTITEFDLTPDPRVLQILGEINLEQWKCLAELIDNSVDAFINARRGDSPIGAPEVVISLPTHDRDDAAVSVRDNGPGMTLEQLERSVKAGWSGNNPLDNLGLFGMGFNIATARLGLVTEVYTTRAGDSEWVGLRIDLSELKRTRTYHTPRLSRPKQDPSLQGTEIRVLKLKPDQRHYFARSANLSKIRRQLSRIYAPLLMSSTDSFALQINGQAVKPKRHCHWNPERQSQGADGRPVHAVEQFDFKLPSRHYCKACMLSFSGNGSCPTGGVDCQTVELKRRLRGWIGIQRYMHEEDFGVDLVRNGRVIESQTKDLFFWTGGERPEREYPIDDQRNRGRFIGEIHIDHCRVSYTKDRFERDDPSWAEMVSLVRGEGPLQPQKGKALGFEPSAAPLYRLFQAFRRSSPQGKTGRWSRILAVKNNERACEMAELFHKGDPEYQSDEKWFDLVEEEDRKLVGDGLPIVGGVGADPVTPAGFLDDGDSDQPPSAADIPIDGDTGGSPTPAPLQPARVKLHELTRLYKHPLLKVEFNVEAFSTTQDDPDLSSGAPWILKIDDPGTRTFVFVYNPEHSAFRSITLRPGDALLSELALKTYEFLRDSNHASASFAIILADLRKEYAQDVSLDAKLAISSAETVLGEIAQTVAFSGQSEYLATVFDGLPEMAQDQIRRKIAAAGLNNAKEVIDSGDFLTYAGPGHIQWIVEHNPHVFFDGKCWTQPYESLDFGKGQVTDDARASVLARYASYLTDAVWLATQTPRDLERCDRDEFARSLLSVRLLRPDGSN